MPQGWKRWASEAVELLLLIGAFGFLVPPVPSTEGQVHRFAPAAFIGGVLFASATVLRCRRGAQLWPLGVAKLILYLALGWLLHERVQMH